MIQFEIKGQIKGGKNNICITRTGRRFPNAKWAKWRDGVVARLRNDFPVFMIDKPCHIAIIYTPEDKRRRDIPAVVDSIFHCLEKAGIVTDDCLFKTMNFTTHEPDKAKAGAYIAIEPLGA